jgi:hypothetical protein
VQLLLNRFSLTTGRQLAERSTSGGSDTITGSPSTIRVSFENAVMLSRVRALASVFSVLFAIPFLTSPRSRAISSSTSRRAYQTSNERMPANCRIALR